MARKKREPAPLATIWRTPDALWDMIQQIIAELDPPYSGHRQRIDLRRALDGIIYHMRSGCQWNQLPVEFGDDSSVHRTMQRWIAKGVFDRIWEHLVQACQDLGGVDWEWQSADGAMSKARLAALWPCTSARSG